jgi:hypothetical protein
MIPQRMLSSEIYGLKSRVTACRKRLRVNRMMHKAHVNNDAEELFQGTTPPLRLEFHDYPAAPASVVHLNYSPAFAEPRDCETLLAVGEQEVGIT